MRNKVNGLLHYHSVQTTPVGTSALHWFRMHVCVAALHQKSEEKMTETEFLSWQNANISVCVCVWKRKGKEWAGPRNCVKSLAFNSWFSWCKCGICMEASVCVRLLCLCVCVWSYARMQMPSSRCLCEGTCVCKVAFFCVSKFVRALRVCVPVCWLRDSIYIFQD